MQVVSVLIPLGLPGPYDYGVPEEVALAPGDFVRVPLGPREVHGVVWGAGEGDTPRDKLKRIIARHDVPPLTDELRQFVDWVAAYVMAPPGQVLRQVMRVPAAFEPARPVLTYRDTATRPDRMTPERQRVFDVLSEIRAETGTGPEAETSGLTASDLTRRAGVGRSVVKGLVETGYLQSHALPGHKPFARPDPTYARIHLSQSQNPAAAALVAAINGAAFGTHLLDGVTGSGKTEVYFEAIAAALMQGRQALVLVPEISLTVQFLDRFEARFGCPPALWHSGLSPAERRRTWREVVENRVPVLVGARSALFLPWRDLGLIIVDEEHDAGFKQEEGVVYNARDMAVVRARFAHCPAVLVSATPSLESYVNAQNDRYQHHRLESRHGGAELPKIELVDMRVAPPPRGQWMVPQIHGAIQQAFEKGEQALLFLNRRGYAPLTICRACGHRYACPSCDAWMVEHRFRRELQCHHCGHLRPVPAQCDACGEADKLAACGPGVERIMEEVVQHFPDARVAILSSDHIGDQVSDQVSGMAAMRATIQQISDGDVDIIVGTQIIAKGHHFPKLSFVGVIDADLGLGNGDLRAAERTYQLLTQVAGRSGRAAVKGRALLQTHMPEHPVLQALAAGDRDGFLAREIKARELAAMPPYGRLAALIITATSASEGQQFITALARCIPSHDAIRVLGPAPAPIARIRDRYRFRFLLKGAKASPMQAFIAAWLADVKLRGSIRMAIDIDPYSFL